MRGSDERSGSLFSYVDLEARVGPDHPLRTIREIANAALADLTVEFAALYPARLGRPSIALAVHSRNRSKARRAPRDPSARQTANVIRTNFAKLRAKLCKTRS